MRLTIIGGGISGLSLAHSLKKRLAPENPIKEILLLEADSRAGGKVRTEKADGFLCEWSVNGFLDNRPQIMELSKELALSPLKSSDAARRRYVYSGGKLRQLPESPGAFLASDVLSPLGKLRIMMEPFIPRKTDPGESLASFARRRLGKEAYETLINPMASGIFAGDPENMNVTSCFPRVKTIENKYGSLIKGMIKLAKEAKKSGKGPVGAGPGGTLTSYYEGMEQLIVALKVYLSDNIRLGAKALSIESTGKGFLIYLQGGDKIETDLAVLACPAYEASHILKDLDKELSSTAADIPYPAVSVVSLGFRAEKIPGSTDLFGFLVPGIEGRKILGTLYDSSIFPNRAPRDFVLLRVMTGGARASALAMKDDDALIDIARSELKDILKITAEPDFHRVFRHEKAIPQYTLDHHEKLAGMDSALTRHPGLYITGNAYRGVSLPDCVENSEKLARKIITDRGGSA